MHRGLHGLKRITRIQSPVDPGETSAERANVPGRARKPRTMVERLRVLALVTALVGAAGSLAFVLRAGRNTPRLLLFLFIVWVTAPFAALVWANVASKSWSVPAQVTLYWVTPVVALGGLGIYAYFVLTTPRPTPAFVLVPPVSALMVAVVVVSGVVRSRRQS